MKNRILVLLFVVSVCLFGLFNVPVYAQSNSFPVAPRALIYDTYEFVQINNSTYEYVVVYYLPYIVTDDISLNDYVFVPYYNWGFYRGVFRPTSTTGSYVLEDIVILEDKTEFYFRFSMYSSRVDIYSGDLTLFFANDSVMYINFDYKEPNEVMKNFLLAEPNLNNGFEQMIGNEKYYMYLDARVYLPDGTYSGLSALPDVISDRSELFGDFVAVAFNLSPRARFWSSVLLTDDYIAGLSYIVYDIVANTTTIYDYMGRVVYQEDAIIYIDTPQFLIPEMEALDYQLKVSYEEGKNEGYKQGREEGIRAGKRQMQEEMQQVIDNLTEYYEEEVRKAYNRGKLDGANEEFDIFGYLQALFGEQGLGRLLRLELLPGVSLGAVIMIPLAFWLVSFIMRWFR